MSSGSNHHPGLRAVATTSLIFAEVAAISLVAYGGYLYGVQPDAPGDALGFITAGIGVGAIAALLYVAACALLKAISSLFRSYNALLDVCEFLRRQVEYARATAETSAMSDWAKRTVYREKDYEFLRDTIQGALVRQDWAMAEHLIRELDEQFGLKDAARELRDEMTKRRQSTVEDQVQAALDRFDAVCKAHKWAQAQREIERLGKLFPGEARIAGLPHELELRKNHHKRELLREYNDTVRHGEVEKAHALLLELDHYLTPNEAAALKESARGVFKAKLQQMGVEFSMAISERRYASAMEVGVALVREFPNSRYAHEIQNMLPKLRERAVQQRDGAARP